MKKKNQDLEAMFLRPKPARLLIYARSEDKPYASVLAKKIDCTYAHTVKLLAQMKQNGLVKFRKTGRVKYVKLTDYGSDLAADFDKLVNKKFAKISQKTTTKKARK